jgi:formate/nitrite transporter FocA (FNT family)
MSLVTITTSDQAEAYQILSNIGGVFYALSYLIMFAIPLVGLRSETSRPPLWIKVASGIGFLMTLLYVVLSPLPPPGLVVTKSYGISIVVVTLIANIIGVLIFLRGKRRRQGKLAEKS